MDPALADEVVPMLFQMGPDARAVLTQLHEHEGWPLAVCDGAAGVSTDEPWPPLPRARIVYVFHPKPWTVEAARAVIDSFGLSPAFHAP
jgi:hypothetical protein